MWWSIRSPLLIGLIVILGNSLQVCGFSSDSCDWVGSGLHQTAPQGVKPLYLRCTQGYIRWHYPRGAIRVLLRPSLLKFQGCVRIAAGSTGARLYLEGEKKLYSLYRPGDGKSTDLHRCFTSRRGQAALYVEADPPTDLLKKDVIEFSYDLELQNDLGDEMEECKPCSDEEIMMSYCSSDFVVKGTVSSLSHNASVQRSEVIVRATKVVRDAPLGSWGNFKYVTLYRPLKCGTKVGKGEFVFLGRQRLGLPVIHCAPRLIHWKEIRRKALMFGRNPCQLD